MGPTTRYLEVDKGLPLCKTSAAQLIIESASGRASLRGFGHTLIFARIVPVHVCNSHPRKRLGLSRAILKAGHRPSPRRTHHSLPTRCATVPRVRRWTTMPGCIA